MIVMTKLTLDGSPQRQKTAKIPLEPLLSEFQPVTIGLHFPPSFVCNLQMALSGFVLQFVEFVLPAI